MHLAYYMPTLRTAFGMPSCQGNNQVGKRRNRLHELENNRRIADEDSGQILRAVHAICGKNRSCVEALLESAKLCRRTGECTPQANAVLSKAGEQRDFP